jgi:hypothetical protein
MKDDVVTGTGPSSGGAPPSHGGAGAGASHRSTDYQPQAGDLVLLRWDPTSTRIARFVRHNRAGNPVVQVERVAGDGSRIEGQFGIARCFGRADILGPANGASGAPTARGRRGRR